MVNPVVIDSLDIIIVRFVPLMYQSIEGAGLPLATHVILTISLIETIVSLSGTVRN